MLAVFNAYMDRKKSGEVAAAAGVSKGRVSGYLNEIEAAIGCRIVRGRPEGGSVTAALKGDNSLLRVKREGRRAPGERAGFPQFAGDLGYAGADGRRAAGTGAEGDRAQDDRHRAEALLPAGPGGFPPGVGGGHAEAADRGQGPETETTD